MSTLDPVLSDLKAADRAELEARLGAKIAEVAKELFEEVKDDANPPRDAAKIGVLIEKLLGSGIIDWRNFSKVDKSSYFQDLLEEIESITPRFIKSSLAAALPGTKASAILMTADLVTKFIDKVCVTRSTSKGGSLANRPAARPPSNKKAEVDFLYDIQTLPKIVRANGKSLTPAEKERLFLDATDRWVENSSLKFHALQDVLAQPEGAAKASKANLFIKCVPIDGTGKTIALTTFGERGKLAKLSRYEILIDASETWTVDRFRAMMIHELGHLFGLDDSQNQSEVMFGFLTEPFKTEPTAAEIARLKSLGWG